MIPFPGPILESQIKFNTQHDPQDPLERDSLLSDHPHSACPCPVSCLLIGNDCNPQDYRFDIAVSPPFWKAVPSLNIG